TDLPAGTVVLTSGLGLVYPRGIPVGRVTELAEEDAGWRRSYWLEPMVEPGSVTHVLVATDLRHLPRDVSETWPADSILSGPELHALEESRRDSLALMMDSVAKLRARLRELAPPSDTSGASPPGGGRRP
ncbi:MAG TPA: rod shape-determining protein MreC, partial [Longimicrobiales bacterium]|nr:rod shape-determining protein MreC [Longimicrobiales bacterium]